MSGQPKNGMQCAEFDALLSDALDGNLSGQKFDNFQSHSRSCAVCGPLMAEAEAGRRYLKSLEPVEAPPHLLENILVATSGIDSFRLASAARAGGQISSVGDTWFDRLQEWAGTLVSPVIAVARQPRFAMSFGMAFFSLSISLSLAGVKLSNVRHADLRPSAIKRTYYETSGRVVKYYENIRFVYEIESRVREFKRATTPAEPAPQDQDKGKSPKNNSSEHQEQNQQRNYSQGENQPMLASSPNDPPVVMSMDTNRRYS
ncbi:MAG: putative transrane transcriptional regulator [Acidobacteriaceae bacterium]|nr:putative transrane transcriptional regulator [Acidobacteriaceae bacterium]